MNQRKWLNGLSVLFSITTITLILCEWIFGHPSTYTEWAELSLPLMFLTGGLRRHLDKERYARLYLGTGLFVLVVFISITMMR